MFAAFSVNAQVAYLLTVASVDDFPAETFNEVDQQPERNAANWLTLLTTNRLGELNMRWSNSANGYATYFTLFATFVVLQ